MTKFKAILSLSACAGLLFGAHVEPEGVETPTESADAPCPWCCPPWDCGFNGPELDGLAEGDVDGKADRPGARGNSFPPCGG